MPMVVGTEVSSAGERGREVAALFVLVLLATWFIWEGAVLIVRFL